MYKTYSMLYLRIVDSTSLSMSQVCIHISQTHMQVKQSIEESFDIFLFDRYNLCHMPLVAVMYRGLFDEVKSHCLKCVNILPQSRTTRSLIWQIIE